MSQTNNLIETEFVKKNEDAGHNDDSGEHNECVSQRKQNLRPSSITFLWNKRCVQPKLHEI